MQSLKSIDNSSDLNLMFSSNYLEQTVDFYELAIAAGDENSNNYWYLGLAYLLTEREIDAQSTWFIPFDNVSELEIVTLTDDLAGILDRVASQKLSESNLDESLLICQYLREIDPTHINNLLRSILLEIELDLFTPEVLAEWEGVELLSTHPNLSIDRALLFRVVEALISFRSTLTSEFICQCLSSFPQDRSTLIELICQTSLSVSHRSGASASSIELLEICREFQPANDIILQILCKLNCSLGRYQQAIDLSIQIYNLCNGSADRVIASANIIRTMLTAGDWQNVQPIVDRHQQLLEIFFDDRYEILAPHLNQGLMVSATFLPYTIDRPDNYRSLQNRIAQIYLSLNQRQPIDLQTIATALPKPTGVLRIGYLASTLRSHSVGWLSRWLWQYHDRDRFQICTYCINQNPDDPIYQQWFRDRSDLAYCFGSNADEIVAQIRADRVDILIDLDSLTLDTTCKVLAAKPAPIQVSWLGWDATGLPTVDYFIADRYVLPENAQEYYQEKIWRLPQCYLAVDGFEVGTPTIRRDDLGISDNAVIYWSGQRGYKRHPQTIKAQMQILKLVPNSYLLIKGESDRQTVEDLFGAIAIEIGVEIDRLRFLNTVADEMTHRANLSIADIVLDTFPYNGATTTLETLWMGIPMVTQVGEQFAARNSYTFMLNAGITEGIAWNDREYIDWGVKLGLDRSLRMQVRDKLRLGRQTAPVWNAKQFTLDLEQAYREMWAQNREQQDLTNIDRSEQNGDPSTHILQKCR
jgi:predicted O-linked N-acetylglucosamine transferase (SPINDLY family)